MLFILDEKYSEEFQEKFNLINVYDSELSSCLKTKVDGFIGYELEYGGDYK